MVPMASHDSRSEQPTLIVPRPLPKQRLYVYGTRKKLWPLSMREFMHRNKALANGTETMRIEILPNASKHRERHAGITGNEAPARLPTLRHRNEMEIDVNSTSTDFSDVEHDAVHRNVTKLHSDAGGISYESGQNEILEENAAEDHEVHVHERAHDQGKHKSPGITASIKPESSPPRAIRSPQELTVTVGTSIELSPRTPKNIKAITIINRKSQKYATESAATTSDSDNLSNTTSSPHSDDSTISSPHSSEDSSMVSDSAESEPKAAAADATAESDPVDFSKLDDREDSEDHDVSEDSDDSDDSANSIPQYMENTSTSHIPFKTPSLARVVFASMPSLAAMLNMPTNSSDRRRLETVSSASNSSTDTLMAPDPTLYGEDYPNDREVQYNEEPLPTLRAKTTIHAATHWSSLSRSCSYSYYDLLKNEEFPEKPSPKIVEKPDEKWNKMSHGLPSLKNHAIDREEMLLKKIFSQQTTFDALVSSLKAHDHRPTTFNSNNPDDF